MNAIQTLKKTFPLQLLIGIIVLSGCASSGSNKALSASDLFDRHIENSFGVDGLKNHSSITSTGRIIVEDFGIDSPLTMYQMSPNNMLMKTELMGSAVRSGCNSEMCWNQQPGQEVRVLEGSEKLRFMQQADFHIYENIGKYYETLLIEAPAEGSTTKNHKVVATATDGEVDSYYFSKESGLLIGAILKINAGQGLESVRISYNKYKDFGGMKIASEVIQTMSIATMKMVIEDVSYEPLSQDIFVIEK